MSIVEQTPRQPKCCFLSEQINVVVVNSFLQTIAIAKETIPRHWFVRRRSWQGFNNNLCKLTHGRSALDNAEVMAFHSLLLLAILIYQRTVQWTVWQRRRFHSRLRNLRGLMCYMLGTEESRGVVVKWSGGLLELNWRIWNAYLLGKSGGRPGDAGPDFPPYCTPRT